MFNYNQQLKKLQLKKLKKLNNKNVEIVFCFSNNFKNFTELKKNKIGFLKINSNILNMFYLTNLRGPLFVLYGKRLFNQLKYFKLLNLNVLCILINNKLASIFKLLSITNKNNLSSILKQPIFNIIFLLNVHIKNNTIRRI